MIGSIQHNALTQTKSLRSLWLSLTTTVREKGRINKNCETAPPYRNVFWDNKSPLRNNFPELQIFHTYLDYTLAATEAFPLKASSSIGWLCISAH